MALPRRRHHAGPKAMRHASMRDTSPAVFRRAASVRVELADRVLRYEITETFVNGEAESEKPISCFRCQRVLPSGSEARDQWGAHSRVETMSADRARQISRTSYAASGISAARMDGIWTARARNFPIAPGEQKRAVVRFQTVAPREGDAIRVDYFRGMGQASARQLSA